jgi:predicted NBD/HSP70 family sugar kinase
VVVDEDGPILTCGNTVFLETPTSTLSILRQAQEIAGSQPASHLAAATEVEWQTIVGALEAGDAATRNMVATAGKYLGVAIANLVGSLNIHHVVVCGRVSQLGDVFLDAAQAETRRRVLPAMAASTEVTYSTLGTDVVILGSSAMTLKHELGIT